MRRYILTAILGLFTATPVLAGLNAPRPGEETVYQTVQSGVNYRTFHTQITGNAFTNYGDEIKLDGSNRYVTNIAVATQTADLDPTPGYMDGVNSQPPTPGFEDQGGFLELTLFSNDSGLADGSGDPFVDATPHGQIAPGTVIARSRIPTPTYPEGGVSKSANGLNDPNNPNDNGNDPWIVNFPFPNVLLPEVFTFALVNLNASGVPDGYNFDGNQFGLWHGTLQVGTPTIPTTGGPFYYGTNYNTNVVGTSRTGADTNRFTNNGQYTWYQYNGPRVSPTPWESDRDNNSGAEATIYAVADPLIVGDMDGDGDVDNFDIQPFEQALTDSAAYLAQYPELWNYEFRGDIDGDGDFDNFDIQPFEQLLTSGGAAVPEPSTIILLGLGFCSLVAAGRRRLTR